MGLFRRKSKEPVELPDVERVIVVRAQTSDIHAHSRAYDDIAGLVDPEPVTVTEKDGWVGLTLPPTVHPWAFHNFALWLLDTPGVDGDHLVAVSGPDGTHPGYWLINDPHDSWMSGYDDNGGSVTVSVPENGVVRGDALPHPPRTLQQVLDDIGAPADLARPTHTGVTVDFKFEHPNRDLNPHNDTTKSSRKALEDIGQAWV